MLFNFSNFFRRQRRPEKASAPDALQNHHCDYLCPMGELVVCMPSNGVRSGWLNQQLNCIILLFDDICLVLQWLVLLSSS